MGETDCSRTGGPRDVENACGEFENSGLGRYIRALRTMYCNITQKNQTKLFVNRRHQYHERAQYLKNRVSPVIGREGSCTLALCHSKYVSILMSTHVRRSSKNRKKRGKEKINCIHYEGPRKPRKSPMECETSTPRWI